VRVLLTGAAGQVGRAFSALTPAGVTLAALSHADLDITDALAVRRAVALHAPQWIVNAAAYTAVGYLAEAAHEAHARLVQLSTDFVFDGRAARPYEPDANTAPLGAYGASKLAGERGALAGDARAIVVRTSWVYAAYGHNFVRTMLRLMAKEADVRVVCDQIGAPTWATGLARALWQLLNIDAGSGIYHWCDAGIASWYDFAVAIQEEALARGLLRHAVRVLPIRTAEYPSAAVRPPYSVLDSAKTRALTGEPAVHWRAQLRRMLDELTTQ
jgi:dTDP-4-dehydrorhamnose reductase